jgi:hypothetical protein
MAPARRPWRAGFLGVPARWYVAFDRLLLLRLPLIWRSRMIPALLLAPLGWALALVMAQAIPVDPTQEWNQSSLELAELSFLLLLLLVCALWGRLQLRYPLGERYAGTHLVAVACNIVVLAALLSANPMFQGEARSRIARALPESELEGYLDAYRRLDLDVLLDAEGRDIRGRSFKAQNHLVEMNCAMPFPSGWLETATVSTAEMLTRILAGCESPSTHDRYWLRDIEVVLRRGDSLLTILLHQGNGASSARYWWDHVLRRFDLLLIQALAGAALLFALSLPTTKWRRGSFRRDGLTAYLPAWRTPHFLTQWQRRMSVRWPTIGRLAPLSLALHFSTYALLAPGAWLLMVYRRNVGDVNSGFLVLLLLMVVHVTVFWWLRLSQLKPRLDTFWRQFRFSLTVCVFLSPIVILMAFWGLAEGDTETSIFMSLFFVAIQMSVFFLANALPRLQSLIAGLASVAVTIAAVAFLDRPSLWEGAVWLLMAPAVLTASRTLGKRSPSLRWLATLTIVIAPAAFIFAIDVFDRYVPFIDYGIDIDVVALLVGALFLTLHFLLVMPALLVLADCRYGPQRR